MPSSKYLFNQITNELSSIYDAEEARSIAFLLLEHVFHLNKAAVLADKLVEEADNTLIENMIARLKNNEPVQYVLGETTFFGRLFKVNKHVLIPRPETEELVDVIIRENTGKSKLKILDIGTGSGCIAVSLAAFLPQAEVIGIDISLQALQVAQINARVNQVSIEFIGADILDDQIYQLFKNIQLDIIVSNPPYVTYAEKPLMRKNVTDYEPPLALFVTDNDPLLFYWYIIKFCLGHLKKRGSCYVEINEQFAKHIEALFLENGFIGSKTYKDMFGKERFVKGVL